MTARLVYKELPELIAKVKTRAILRLRYEALKKSKGVAYVDSSTESKCFGSSKS